MSEDEYKVEITTAQDIISAKPKKPKKERKTKEVKNDDLNNIEDDDNDNLEQTEGTDLRTGDGRSDTGQLLPQPGDLLPGSGSSPRGTTSDGTRSHSGSAPSEPDSVKTRRTRNKKIVSPAVRRWRGLSIPGGYKKRPHK